MAIICDVIDTPLGQMRIGVDSASDSLVLLDFHDRKSIDQLVQQRIEVFGSLKEGSHPLIEQTKEQLSQYFAGERQAFDLPLTTAGTKFQQQVWQELQNIPFGETRSYGEMARALSKPVGTSRAIGAANGKNVIAIVIPCHRVIGADGSLVGYGGGMDRKRKLLQHENRLSNQSSLDNYF